jgi:hypothetical protein
MNGLMGMFLLQLSALKLFNITGFADGFAKYDVIAARLRVYGLAYPFIELGLGGLYLSGLAPLATNLVTLAVMVVGSIGVVKMIRAGAKVSCVCVGTGFDLPVGRVTLAENAVMAAMALYNLLELYR